MVFWIIFWYCEMSLKWYLISDLFNLFDKWIFEVYINWVYLNDIGFMKCGRFKVLKYTKDWILYFVDLIYIGNW